MPAESPTRFDANIDWIHARQFLRERLRREIDACDESQLDDLVQEACVRLLRACRRESIQQLEALMATIARRTWADHLRRRIVARRWLEPYGDEFESTPADRPLYDPQFGDILQRLELVIGEFFRRQAKPECQQLATAHFEGRGWNNVANELSISDVTVRKRWSRCVSLLRDEFERDPALRGLALWS